MAFTRLKIATMIESISNVKDQRTLINDAIQMALERVFEYHDFPYYLDERTFKTVDDYSTGTVSVTNGSATVTGTNTVWVTTWTDRKIRFNGENAYYRVKTVNSPTSITLEQPYQGNNNSTATYNIYQDEYRLAADVDKYKTMRQAQNAIAMFSYHPTRFDEVYPMPNNYNDPVYEIMEGTKLDIYTTGTVSGSINTNTITGSGTAWTSVEGLGRMSMIRIANDIYTVKSVDSATQITTYEKLANGASGATYEILLNNLRVQLYQIPNAQRVIYYRCFRRPAILTNDYDLPDMPGSFHWILVYGALAVALMQKGDINKAQTEAEARFVDGLNLMKLKLGSFTPDRIYQKESMDRMRGVGEYGLENSAFDRRWSMP